MRMRGGSQTIKMVGEQPIWSRVGQCGIGIAQRLVESNRGQEGESAVRVSRHARVGAKKRRQGMEGDRSCT